MDTISKVKLLLGLSDTDERDSLLELIIESVQTRLALLVGSDLTSALDHIVVEVSVARFNRIGNEGMASTSQEGGSISYASDNDFAPYMDEIRMYMNTVDSAKGRVRFI